MLMAQAFDEKKLQIRGQAFPVGPDRFLYDQLLWRGVFSCSANGILAYQGAHNGADSRLIMFDRAGKELKTVGTRGGSQRPQDPDGQRLAVVALDSSVANYKLWIYDLFREKSDTPYLWIQPRYFSDLGTAMGTPWSFAPRSRMAPTISLKNARHDRL